MIAFRLYRDVQPLGYPLAVQTLGQRLQHLFFSDRETRDCSRSLVLLLSSGAGEPKQLYNLFYRQKRFTLFKALHGLGDRAGLPDDREARLSFEDGCYTLPKRGVVLNKQDAHFLLRFLAILFEVQLEALPGALARLAYDLQLSSKRTSRFSHPLGPHPGRHFLRVETLPVV